MAVLFGGVEFCASANMLRDFALLLAVGVVSNPEIRATLKNPALSARVHGYSFPQALRNSETVCPFALAFFSSFRYSNSDIRSFTILARRPISGSTGRPMRVFFTLQFPRSYFCGHISQALFLFDIPLDPEGRKQQFAPLASG